MNKVIEIIILEHKRFYKQAQELAFDECGKEGKCSELCARDKMCINEAVIGWWWLIKAKLN